MTPTQRTRIGGFFSEIKNGLTLAILTALLTIAIAMVLSALVGGESRRLLQQAVFNGEEVVDHAIISRCESSYVAELLRAIGSTNEEIADSIKEFPPINVDGLPCDKVITQPFTPGGDFGIEGPSAPAFTEASP